MIMSLSVALIAVAFAVLVVYLIKTLLAAKSSLEKTTQTLQEVQSTIDELSYEIKQIVRHANDITADVEHKMKQIDPVMNSVKNLGEVLSEVTLAAKQASTTLIHRFKQPKHQVESRPRRIASASTPEERTIQSYSAVYETGAKAKPAVSMVKWIDTAAAVWQRLRH
ncbi:DUF948 domain-containing protein [Paenibacillus sp. XY044]|uniref:DUF948 domain-containing protein n=1 Tax=Paenibacillus sp. XY044 TaxID=2026089 RepID=UPI000B980FA0|nr:DUF948 domain-containing protein [Paenibacillus sp. XY044]OZB90518.1 hypothetical protein CJP46_33435 [Paenibacillus sp. XY044]